MDEELFVSVRSEVNNIIVFLPSYIFFESFRYFIFALEIHMLLINTSEFYKMLTFSLFKTSFSDILATS